MNFNVQMFFNFSKHEDTIEEEFRNSPLFQIDANEEESSQDLNEFIFG
jgi:hypothetical protein